MEFCCFMHFHSFSFIDNIFFLTLNLLQSMIKRTQMLKLADFPYILSLDRSALRDIQLSQLLQVVEESDQRAPRDACATCQDQLLKFGQVGD